jgi:hypothetical protein
MSIFGFGIPQKSLQTASFSWRPFIVLGIVLVFAFGLRIYQWVQGPVVPTADVPSVGWNDVAGQENDASLHLIEPLREDTYENEDSEDAGDILADNIAPEVTNKLLPDAVNLAVPFTSQAPYGIWDTFTEEACEEASFLMASFYYQGIPEGAIDPAMADADFRSMVAVEESLGFGPSISAAQFVAFADAYNATQVRIVEDPSVDDIKALLAAGNPVLVPAYGRKLGNPFFTGEGPLYHMLVLRGYTPTTFIANDPGTRHGENYQYSYDVLMQAIGDWDGDSPDAGARVMVIEP